MMLLTGLSVLAVAALFVGLELQNASAAQPLVIVCDKNVADEHLRDLTGNDGFTKPDQECFVQTFTGAPVVVKFVN
jgi:hypothetical protein